jgi:hypothetical protein
MSNSALEVALASEKKQYEANNQVGALRLLKETLKPVRAGTAVFKLKRTKVVPICTVSFQSFALFSLAFWKIRENQLHWKVLLAEFTFAGNVCGFGLAATSIDTYVQESDTEASE